MLTKAYYISDNYNYSKLITHQANYSLLRRDLELDIIPASLEYGIGTMVWGPLHGGILTGKYRNKDKWPKGTRLKKPGDHSPYDVEQGEKILDKLELIAEKRNVSLSQVSLNYMLRKQGVSTVVIGARNKKQLIDNIRSTEWKLDDEEIKELNELSSPYQYYPHWYYNIFWTDNYKKFYLPE